MGGFRVDGCGAKDYFKKMKYLGERMCPRCKMLTPFYLEQVKHKVSVFYIPTVTLKERYAIMCDSCKTGALVEGAEMHRLMAVPEVTPPVETIPGAELPGGGTERVCQRCGSRGFGVFCSKCGARYEAERTEPNPGQARFCSRCGAEVQGAYCSSCGARYEATAQPPADPFARPSPVANEPTEWECALCGTRNPIAESLCSLCGCEKS